MQFSKKTIVLSLLLGVLLLALAVQFIRFPLETYQETKHTTNAGELVTGSLVGQTFASRYDNLSSVSVLFATYSDRANTAPVRWQLKESLASPEVLREAVVQPSELGDNQFYRFRFEPLPDSAGKTYFFALTSPTGQPGNAVTVDLNTQDPYHLGSAYLVKNAGGQVMDPAVLARSGKQTVDVVFGLHHTVPLRVGLLTWAREAAHTFVTTWEDKRGQYRLWAELLAAVLLFAGLAVGLARHAKDAGELSKRAAWQLLGVVAVAGLLLRLRYATTMPLTNDEGNYLYDAASLLRGVLAGGDGYVKAPLVILWMSLWQLLLGPTLLAGRVASIFAGLLTLLPVYSIGSSLAGRRAGVLAAAAWGLLGAPVVFTIYAHTQPVAVLFGTAGIALLLLALKRPEGYRLFLLAGALLGLGVASRKSVLALGLIPLMLVLLTRGRFSVRLGRLAAIGLGFLLIIGLFLGYAWQVYGPLGVQEALGLQSAEDGLYGIDPAERQQAVEYSLRGITPFFRESLLLIFLALAGWGLVLESVAARWSNRWMAKLAWLLPLAAGWWGWSFFIEYEGSRFHEFGNLALLWYFVAGALILLALWPSKAEKDLAEEPPASTAAAQLSQLAASLLPFLWVGGLYVFYSNWIKFHANYLIEFLVPLAIFSGVGAYLMLRRITTRWWMLAPLALLIIWVGYTTQYVTYYFEHTGTFDLRSIEEAADWARANIPPDETIFTGAAAIPYRSGHRTTLDIAHPRWYAYEFTRKNTERLSTFLPSAGEMVAAFREAEWVLLERQTGFSFLMEYTEIERALLETQFTKVHEVENLSNPLQFYRRVRPAGAN